MEVRLSNLEFLPWYIMKLAILLKMKVAKIINIYDNDLIYPNENLL